jgi:hypothetical protein
MLLEKLCEYAERLDLPPTMYVKTAIRWLIDLDVQILCLSTGSQQVAVGKLLFHELSIDYYGGENP